MRIRPMKTLRPIALLSLTAALALLAPAPAWASTPEAVAVEGDFKPGEQAGRLLDATDAKALKGLKKVAISQFSVEFITFDSVSAQTSGFAAAGRASVTGRYKLVGVGEPDFQALCDTLHGRFVQMLRDRGYEVVEQAQVAAAPTWRKLVAGGEPLPARSDRAITVGLPGGGIFGLSRVGAAPTQSGPFGALSAVAAGFSAIGATTENMTLQQELGGAALLEVNLRVHFAQLTNETKGFLARLGDKAEVSAKVHPVVTRGRVSVANGPAVVNLDLKQPLLLDPEAFTELRKEAKTAGDVARAVAVGLLRLAIGSKDSHSSETFEAVTEPARYRERLGGALGTVSELFVARLAAER